MKADKACIDVAAGRAPADLVFKNVNVVNVFSEEIITADAVSYTHLDVYKRQILPRAGSAFMARQR